MTITTFAKLTAAVADFLDRDDLTSSIPTFIQLAETDLNRNARHWRAEKRSTATIDTQYSAVPDDFVEAIRFYITSNDTRPLELISQSELLSRKANTLNTSGEPGYYAITAGEFEVYPVPDGSYTAELYYYSRLAALSESNTSNWMLTYFPDAYLYGALVHSAPYLGEDARLAVWQTLYGNAVSGILADNEQAKFGGSGRRMKIRSY